jgi:uncharacterized protein (DUF58 family)
MASPSSATAISPPLHERVRRWMKPPRQLAFTASGKYFVLMTLAVGFGAINTGNNLLFLLLGMMLSLILASGVLSEAVLRRLKAHRMAPQRIYAGIPSPAHFRLTNPKKWASLSIEVSEGPVRAVHGPLQASILGPTAHPWWKFWKSTARDPASIVASSYCLRVDAGEELNVETIYRLPKRGLYRCTSVVVSTRFPFGFFHKSLEIDEGANLIVFPTPAPSKDWAHTVHAHFGDVPSRQRGLGEEFFGLRDAMPGEDSRRIHWKSSARRGELVVRENEAREQRAVELVLAHWTGQDTWTPPHIERAFEEGLERIAGLIEELTSRDYRVGLRTAQEVIPVGGSGVHMDRMLRALATVDLVRGVTSLAQDPLDEMPYKVGRIVIGLPRAVTSVAGPDDLVLPISVSAPDEDSTTEKRKGRRT